MLIVFIETIPTFQVYCNIYIFKNVFWAWGDSTPVPAPGHSTWGGLYDSRGGYGGGGILYKTSRQILIEWIIIVAFLAHHI